MVEHEFFSLVSYWDGIFLRGLACLVMYKLDIFFVAYSICVALFQNCLTSISMDNSVQAWEHKTANKELYSGKY